MEYKLLKGMCLNYLFVSQGDKREKTDSALRDSVKALIKGQTSLCASIFCAFEISLNFKWYRIMGKGSGVLRHQIY